jgi:hypothetical protein
MRIRQIVVQRVCIPFRKSFVHALKVRGETDAIIVIVSSTEGIEGVGEILPRPYLTGEDIAGVLVHCSTLFQGLIGCVWESPEEVLAALEEQHSRAKGALATLAGL